jgi:hypothetical protein
MSHLFVQPRIRPHNNFLTCLRQYQSSQARYVMRLMVVPPCQTGRAPEKARLFFGCAIILQKAVL